MAWMAAAAPYVQYAGMALQAYSAHQGSKGAQQAYGAQAQVAENNRVIAEHQATDAIARGHRTASDVRMRGKQLRGQQRARLAANGVDLSFGSAAEIINDTDYFTELDAGRVIDNAAREAWGYRAQAANFGGDASLLRNRSNSENPALAGATSLLTSAAKVAPSWYSGTGSGRYTVPTYEGAEY